MRTSVVRFAVSAIALASMAALLVIILDHLAPGGSETTVRRTASYLASNGASAGFAILFAGGAVLAALARSFTLALALLPTLMLVFAPLIIGQAQDVSDQVYVPKDAIVLFLGDKDAEPDAVGCPPGWDEVMELAGKMPVGAGQGILPGGVNLSFRTAGDEGGEEFHRLEVDEMPSHDHQFPYAGIYDGPGGGSVGGNNLQRMAGSEGTTNAKGGNNPHSIINGQHKLLKPHN